MIFKKENLRIYLNWDNHIKLENIAREKMPESPLWISKSINPNSKEYSEKMDIYYDEILRIKENEPELFKKSWQNIELAREKAQQNTWNLLNDYCKLNGNAQLRDKRSFEHRLKSDYLGDSYGHFPMGKTFSLILTIPEETNWYGKRVRSKFDIDIVVDTEKVTKINGINDMQFSIYTLKQKLEFGNKITIIPLEKK